ncbi:MAG TPA: response regulator [bacterium]|nr:response regulator [bacterium]
MLNKKKKKYPSKKNTASVVKKSKHIFTILLVEDDDFLLNMYRVKLELEDYKVLTASNGEAGLALIKDKKPDLVLLDIILPKLNGFEVLKVTQQDKNIKNIPVIILSNLGQKEDIKKGLKLGARDYLIKAHFLPSEVIEKIKKILKF